MIITHHREKLINAIVYFSKNVKYCGKTKLLKLLYFLDFEHFKQTGKPVTGLEYFTWKRGPCPPELFEELSGKMKPDLKRSIEIKQIDDFFKILPKVRFKEDYFSTRELNLLKSLSYIYKDAKAYDMVEITHLKNEPWDQTLKNKGTFQPIDYLLAIDNSGGSLTFPEAKERSQEITEMYKIFGTV